MDMCRVKIYRRSAVENKPQEPGVQIGCNQGDCKPLEGIITDI